MFSLWALFAEFLFVESNGNIVPQFQPVRIHCTVLGLLAYHIAYSSVCIIKIECQFSEVLVM